MLLLWLCQWRRRRQLLLLLLLLCQWRWRQLLLLLLLLLLPPMAWGGCLLRCGALGVGSNVSGGAGC